MSDVEDARLDMFQNMEFAPPWVCTAPMTGCTTWTCRMPWVPWRATTTPRKRNASRPLPIWPTAPDRNELGWKETVRMNPGEVTRVLMKSDLPVVPFTVPPSPRTGGNDYVWHCHILEHEERDMMRPLVVL